MKSKMKKLFSIAFIAMLSAWCLVSCSTQKTVSQAASQSKVQTTFFSAHFGESISNVSGRMKLRYGMHPTGDRKEKVVYNVPFAGCDWPYAHLDFVDAQTKSNAKSVQVFSSICFEYKSADKQLANARFKEMQQLLLEKYPLIRPYSSPGNEQELDYTDEDGNTVSLVLKKSTDKPSAWQCLLIYSWGKAEATRLAKATKDI